MAVYVKDKDGGRVKVAGLGARGPAGKSAYQYAAEGRLFRVGGPIRRAAGEPEQPKSAGQLVFR